MYFQIIAIKISKYTNIELLFNYVVCGFYRFGFLCIVVDGSSDLVGRHDEKRIRTARAG